MSENDKIAESTWNQLLTAALALPGARIDRDQYLRSELSKHLPAELVSQAVETSPARAGVPAEVINKIAKGSVWWHRAGVSAVSFVAGLPGCWWIAGTIPADLAQFFWHVVVVAQKLAYLHGWPTLGGDEGEVDDATRQILTLFIGVMMGNEAAARGLGTLAEKLSLELVKRLPRHALTKYALFRIAREVAKWIGIQLTKKKFAEILAKGVPIVGGLVSGTATWFTFSGMSSKLRRHLGSLPLSTGV